jgi:diacylglycerol kinase family enzyme
MPYVIRHYEVGAINSFMDGLLDVLIIDGLSKIDLVGYIVKGSATDMQDDPRIQRLSASKIVIETKPNMEVMVDGITLGSGPIQIEVLRHALNIMVDSKAIERLDESGEVIEK